MRKIVANDPETRSIDSVSQNISTLKDLFPELISEGPDGITLNIDTLKQLVGDQSVTDVEEKYGLNWHGKRRARKLALAPSTGTLRPCVDESLDWENTRNLMIEGDNLEVLKLLQKSYASRVKMIYIDPPYNTGNDFVYPDDFKDTIRNYHELVGQTQGGKTLSSNKAASGRFHTDWLNMIYPRIKVAKSLLKPEGLLLVSSDETEVDHVKKICDEVFGEENFIERIVWKNKYGSGALTRGFANVHEYILVYSREPIQDIAAPLNDEQRADYKLRDEKYEVRGGYLTQPLATTSKDERPNLVYPIMHEGDEIWPEKQWIWAKERTLRANANNELVINKSRGKISVRAKQYLRDENGIERLGKPLSLMNGPFNQEGTKELAQLFPVKVFNFPKPLRLMQYFISFVVNGDRSTDGIFMDFFAGSGTFGQAVMNQNAIDGGSRSYILVQLPEALDPSNNSQKIAANYCKEKGLPLNIAELTKERLRLAARKLTDENPLFPGALGFRVFKLDSTNIKEWNSQSDDIPETLEESVEHLKTDRSEADILYELLLKLGLDLCVPIDTKEIAGKNVHAIGGGVLIACLSEDISMEETESLGQGIVDWFNKLDPAGDTTCVFRDSAFANDVAKTNIVAILDQHGIVNVRSL